MLVGVRPGDLAGVLVGGGLGGVGGVLLLLLGDVLLLPLLAGVLIGGGLGGVGGVLLLLESRGN